MNIMEVKTYNERRRKFKNYMIAHTAIVGRTIDLADIQRVFDNCLPPEEEDGELK